MVALAIQQRFPQQPRFGMNPPTTQPFIQGGVGTQGAPNNVAPHVIPRQGFAPDVMPRFGGDGNGVTPLPKVINQPTQPITRPPQQLPQQLPQATQQFGLSGAESALSGGLQGSIGATQQGVSSALNTLGLGFNESSNFINQGVQNLQSGGFNQPAAGGNIGGGRAQATSAQAAQFDPRTGQRQFEQGIGRLDPFQQSGVQSQQRELALSGVLGQEAFDAARINDPAQAFLREQGEQSRINTASATGGLRGGRFAKEITRFGQGLAAQDLQRQIQNLGQISNRGLSAAQQQAQQFGRAGEVEAGLTSQQAGFDTQTALANAAAANQASNVNAQLSTQAGIAGAGNQAAFQRAQLNERGANTRAATGLFGQGAELAARAAGQGAGFQFGGGQDISRQFGNVAGQVSGGRLQAGRDIGQAINTTTSQLSQLANSLGLNTSNLIGDASQQLNQLIQQAAQSGNQEALAALLANVSTGQGTQQANLANQQGGIVGQDALAQAGNQQQLTGNLLSSLALSGAFNQQPSVGLAPPPPTTAFEGDFVRG